MKIGIVTIMDYGNFGNRLQNYATYHVLKKGLKCEVDSLAAHQEKKFNNGNYIAWIKTQIAQMLCVCFGIAEKKLSKNFIRWNGFRTWSKLIPTKNYYEQKSLPQKVNDQYDYFLAGSDQIWNYHFASRKFDDYFLRFAEDKKKIAISASFGIDEIPEEWKETYIESLKSFSHISVREEVGQKIIKDLIGREVPVLIDPTMMLSKEEWLAVSKRPRVDCSKPYILKYYLGEEKEEDKIDVWARENGYEVYELLNEKIPELYSAGPGEFISLINNAALVCSDSFHCIVFSIIFSKPFVVYSRRGKENYMTSRLDTLLGKFGFQNRWKHLLTEEEYLQCEYTNVEDILKIEQQKFMEFISNAIK